MASRKAALGWKSLHPIVSFCLLKIAIRRYSVLFIYSIDFFALICSSGGRGLSSKLTTVNLSCHNIVVLIDNVYGVEP